MVCDTTSTKKSKKIAASLASEQYDSIRVRLLHFRPIPPYLEFPQRHHPLHDDLRNSAEMVDSKARLLDIISDVLSLINTTDDEISSARDNNYGRCSNLRWWWCILAWFSLTLIAQERKNGESKKGGRRREREDVRPPTLCNKHPSSSYNCTIATYFCISTTRNPFFKPLAAASSLVIQVDCGGCLPVYYMNMMDGHQKRFVSPVSSSRSKKKWPSIHDACT